LRIFASYNTESMCHKAKLLVHASGCTVMHRSMQVDALLGDPRGAMEHETSRNMRTEFMQLWDGLLKARRVLVVAATNQPDRLPDAIWRRFSAHFEVRS
jgi:SpoVK/Ycf46/Vps4 family AAA+-type ATPase